MGCDIHIMVERRYKNKWIGVAHSDSVPVDTYNPDPSERNYQFFAALAGVRGEGPEPKGLPVDISDATRMYVDGWDADGHSHSHMPLKEFVSTWLSVHTDKLITVTAEKLKSPKGAIEYGEIVLNLSMYTCSGMYQLSMDEYRVVFWFDN